MQVTELHRYPIKSMLGERLEAAEIGVRGIAGDRAWALKDEQRGELTSAKRFAALMNMQARFCALPTLDHPSATVEIVDEGLTLRSDASDINALLSERLGHPVSLWPLLPAEAEAHYRREPLPEGTDMEAVLRQVFARTEDEPIPDVSQFPEVLGTHHSEPGTYFDAFPLLIMTRGGVEELARRAREAGSQSLFDMRRFRPNLVIDTGTTGFVEDAWIGRSLTIGEVEVKVEMGCPRCIMTTHGFADLPRDPKIMRALVQHHGGEIGVYATVRKPGVVQQGDNVMVG